MQNKFGSLINYTYLCPMKQVHITTIQAGDTILHNGEVTTISGNNIKHSSFMGTTLFGDSYSLGYKLVTKIIDKNLLVSN